MIGGHVRDHLKVDIWLEVSEGYRQCRQAKDDHHPCRVCQSIIFVV